MIRRRRQDERQPSGHPVEVSLLAPLSWRPCWPSAARRPASAKPAADCQPFAGRPCLFPFPSNLFTRTDTDQPHRAAGSPAGRRDAAQHQGRADRRRTRMTATTASAPAARSCSTSRGLDNAARAAPHRPGRADRHGADVRQAGADRGDRRGDRQAAADLGRARRAGHGAPPTPT